MEEAPPALVFLHGFTNSGASWEPVIARLPTSYRALAPDLRGHASAASRRPVTLAAVLRDIAELELARFTLVGYSQGGRLALHAAVAMPERVRRLVLIGASPGIADPEEREARRLADNRLANRLETQTMEDFAQEWAGIPILAGLSPELARAAQADRMKSYPVGLAEALRGLGTGALPPLWDRLPELTVPVTLIAGQRDTKFRAIAAEMAVRLPDATVVTVEGAGHAVHLERPDAVAEVLIAALGPA